jgi:hypothetical protein
VAVAWATLGVLAATLIASFFYLGNKIDTFGARLDARIDGLGADLRAAIEAQGARLDARIDAIGAHLGSRIDALTASVDGLNMRLDEHIGAHRHTG